MTDRQQHAIDAEDQRLIELAQELRQDPSAYATQAAMAARCNLPLGRFQRRFKALFAVTPKALQSAARLQRFKSALQAGDPVTDAALEAGYGSSSRVHAQATRAIGMTPKSYRAGAADEQISYAIRRSRLGWLLLAATDRGVCSVLFGDSRAALQRDLAMEFPQAHLEPVTAAARSELQAWLKALHAHLDHASPRPALPLDLRGTAFQTRVWRFLLGIEPGTVLSYSEVAAGINQPTAVRAVASACAANRIAVLVPCHRVLRSNGALGGYRWGMARKRTLLAREP